MPVGLVLAPTISHCPTYCPLSDMNTNIMITFWVRPRPRRSSSNMFIIFWPADFLSSSSEAGLTILHSNLSTDQSKNWRNWNWNGNWLRYEDRRWKFTFYNVSAMYVTIPPRLRSGIDQLGETKELCWRWLHLSQHSHLPLQTLCSVSWVLCSTSLYHLHCCEPGIDHQLIETKEL